LIELNHIHKRFGDVAVLQGVDLSVARGEILALLGPSGCGKTTLLRVLAGLESADRGTIDLAGQRVAERAAGRGPEVPPEGRGVGLVFQDFALFPHLDVRANVGFGLTKASRSDREARVEAMLAQFDIASLGGRYPHALSGGQQQRVALARALAPEPRVLLMDEPFSNLDTGLRRRLRVSLRRRLKGIGITTVFVTHDQEEALSLADRVAIMDDGRIVQSDTPEQVYLYPRSVPVALATGRVNLLPGSASRGEVDTPLGRLRGRGPDGEVTVMIRPEQLLIAPESTDVSPPTGCYATVEGRDYVGADLELWLALDGAVPGQEPLIARASARLVSDSARPLEAGQRVQVSVGADVAWCSSGHPWRHGHTI